MGGIVIMESDLILYSVNAIRSMEVVDISTGSKLGYISDFKIDLDTNKIVSIFYLLLIIRDGFLKKMILKFHGIKL